jgi:prevent-host-death family protein
VEKVRFWFLIFSVESPGKFTFDSQEDGDLQSLLEMQKAWIAYSHNFGYTKTKMFLTHKESEVESRVSISKAKDNLPAIIHAVEEGSTVQLTRHGKAVAVLLSLERYRHLTAGQRDYWQALMAFRQTCAPADLVEDSAVFMEVRDRGR